MVPINTAISPLNLLSQLPFAIYSLLFLPHLPTTQSIISSTIFQPYSFYIHIPTANLSSISFLPPFVSLPPLEGEKVSVLNHTYHTNPWGRLKWPYAITRLTANFMCGLISNLMIFKFRKSMVIHDTECPHWDQVLLNSTNQTLFLCHELHTKDNPKQFCSFSLSTLSQ